MRKAVRTIGWNLFVSNAIRRRSISPHTVHAYTILQRKSVGPVNSPDKTYLNVTTRVRLNTGFICLGIYWSDSLIFRQKLIISRVIDFVGGSKHGDLTCSRDTVFKLQYRAADHPHPSLQTPRFGQSSFALNLLIPPLLFSRTVALLPLLTFPAARRTSDGGAAFPTPGLHPFGPKSRSRPRTQEHRRRGDGWRRGRDNSSFETRKVILGYYCFLVGLRAESRAAPQRTCSRSVNDYTWFTLHHPPPLFHRVSGSTRNRLYPTCVNVSVDWRGPTSTRGRARNGSVCIVNIQNQQQYL